VHWVDITLGIASYTLIRRKSVANLMFFLC